VALLRDLYAKYKKPVAQAARQAAGDTGQFVKSIFATPAQSIVNMGRGAVVTGEAAIRSASPKVTFRQALQDAHNSIPTAQFGTRQLQKSADRGIIPQRAVKPIQTASDIGAAFAIPQPFTTVKALESAGPVARLAGYTGIRTAQGAAGGFVNEAGNSGNLDQAQKAALRGGLVGGAANVILSPKLTTAAIKEASGAATAANRAPVFGSTGGNLMSDVTPNGFGPDQVTGSAKKEIQRLKGETLDQAINREVGYQVDNGKVRFEQTSDGWQATVMAAEGPKIIKGYSKQQVTNAVHSYLNPEYAITAPTQVEKNLQKRIAITDAYKKQAQNGELERLRLPPGEQTKIYRAGDGTAEGQYVTTSKANAERYLAERPGSKLTEQVVDSGDLIRGNGLQGEYVYAPRKQPYMTNQELAKAGNFELFVPRGSQPDVPSANAMSQLERDLGRTPYQEKINIFDYLRTPEKVLQKVGLGEEAKVLRAGFEAYKKELPKEIDRITAWSKRVPPESNRSIFQWLDGQGVKLAPDELAVAQEIKSYLKDWANRLGLPEENRVSNYITHIFDREMVNQEFPDELAKLIRDKVPGSVYDPFTQKRLGGKGYVEDVWQALDAYVKRGVRKVNMDPALKTIAGKAEKLEESQFNYVKGFIDRVNMRPTKVDTIMDNTIKSIIGYKYGDRPTTVITGKLRKMIYRGSLGLNFSSAVKNLSQGANTYAELGEKYTTVGYVKAMQNIFSGGDELQRVGVLDDGFVQDRTYSAIKKLGEKADNGLFSLFQFAEKVNRGAAYFGAKTKFLKQGKTEEEAINLAKELVRKTQFSFSSIDTPAALQSDILKTLGQFQSFSVKQGEYLAGKIANKEWAGLLRYTAASLLFIETVGKMIGMEPKDLIPSLRFGVPPTLNAPVTAVKALTGGKDKYGQPLDYKDVGKTLVPYIPAGVQLKKSIEGINAFRQGASTTASGKVRYDIPQNVGNMLKTGILGQYSVPEARNYFDKGSTAVAGASATSPTGGLLQRITGGKKEPGGTLTANQIKTAKKGIDAGNEYGPEVYAQALGYNKKLADAQSDPYKVAKGIFEDDRIPDHLKEEVLSSMNLPTGQLKIRYYAEKAEPLASAKYTYDAANLKEADDLNGWMQATAMRLGQLDSYLSTLDQNSPDYYQTLGKIETLTKSAQKYNSYKGFKKPKKIKIKKTKIGKMAKPKSPTIKKIKIRKTKRPKLI
jgi:hypothetical protein